MREFTRNALQHVPAFRRFASGHAADIESADALVLSALKKLRARWMLGLDNVKIEGFGLIHSLAQSGVAICDGFDSKSTLENDAVIVRALRRLRTLDRSMILLTSVEQLSFHDVANALGVPDSFVINELPLARERLREIVELPLRTGAHKRAHLERIK